MTATNTPGHGNEQSHAPLANPASSSSSLRLRRLGGVALGLLLLAAVALGVWWQMQSPRPGNEDDADNATARQGSPRGEAGDDAQSEQRRNDDDDVGDTTAGNDSSADHSEGDDQEAPDPSIEPDSDTSDADPVVFLDETALLPADHPDVAALLDALRAEDAASLVELLRRFEQAPLEEGWHVFASALAASANPRERATLVALLAGDDPAARWLAAEPAYAEATGRLYTRLLVEHPHWIREAHSQAGFETRAALQLLEAATPLDGVAEPEALLELFAAGQQADNPAVEAALLDYLGRCARAWPSTAHEHENADADYDEFAFGREALVAALAAYEQSQTVRHTPTRHAAALRALVHLDAEAGTGALLGTLEQAHTDAAAARPAVMAFRELVEDGAWPSGDGDAAAVPAELTNALLRLAVPGGDASAEAWELGREGLAAFEALLALPDVEEAHVGAELRRALLDRLEAAALTLDGPAAARMPVRWQEQALRLLLAERGDEAGWPVRLAELAESDDPARVELAVRMLGQLDTPESAQRLRVMGEDPSVPVRTRLAALQALVEGDNAEQELAAPTRELLERTARGEGSSNDDTRVRARAAQLLGERGGAATTDTLIALAQEDPEPSVRAAAIRGLAQGCPPERRNELMRWLEQRARNDPSSHVRNAAHRARATLAGG